VTDWSAQRKNRGVAAIAGAVAIAMLGAAYAAVPLYRMFCQVTGFGGTTQRAEAAPGKVLDRTIAVRFDANTSGALDWSFHPEQTTVTVKLGEQTMAFYRATNNSSGTLTGSAVFNVTPPTAGAFFNKIQCFCFTEQTLGPGESVDMPVVFFVDPDIVNDPDGAGIKEITLSYTFYPVDRDKAVSDAARAPGSVTN
jgi:cytochrome c oxidase assembly protein subunit 11